MKIISWNVNGIRAVYKKNFLGWLAKTNADIVCLQEIKAQKEEMEEIQPSSTLFESSRYQLFINPASKKGYSGVAIFSKIGPLSVKNKLGLERFDQEGRLLELEYSNFTLLNVYLSHGGRQKENLDYKLEVYQYLLNYLKKIKNKNIILIGDFNIAHQEIDLARPKNNKDNIMFTSEERKQIDKIIELGFTDSFRKFHKDNGHYTWWPYGFNARQRNLGWRIDYVFISKSLTPKIKNAFILNKINISDHCPIGIEI